MNLEDKDKIIEGLKNTVRFQDVVIGEYEKALSYYAERGFNKATEVLDTYKKNK